jgi:30S ribosomal protein S31
MGKGDKKSRKGKIAMGSHGVTRPRKKVKTVAAKKAGVSKKAAAPAKPAKTAKTAPKKAAKKAE